MVTINTSSAGSHATVRTIRGTRLALIARAADVSVSRLAFAAGSFGTRVADVTSGAETGAGASAINQEQTRGTLSAGGGSLLAPSAGRVETRGASPVEIQEVSVGTRGHDGRGEAGGGGGVAGDSASRGLFVAGVAVFTGSGGALCAAGRVD